MRKEFLVFLLILMSSPTVQAALIPVGGDFIYDNDLDITWLRDANYAETTHFADSIYTYDTNGEMKWQEAVDWVASLTIDGTSGWHLPTQAQMAHLHYDELGHLLYSDPNWIPGHENTDPFFGVAEGHYWSSQPGYIFNFSEGTSNINASLDLNRFHAWPVHEGKIGNAEPVPLPSTFKLTLSGILTVFFTLAWSRSRSA